MELGTRRFEGLGGVWTFFQDWLFSDDGPGNGFFEKGGYNCHSQSNIHDFQAKSLYESWGTDIQPSWQSRDQIKNFALVSEFNCIMKSSKAWEKAILPEWIRLL